VQAYGSAFARVYNQMWTAFAQAVAPPISDFYEAHLRERALPDLEHKSLLDLCCGTGQLAVFFLEQGYRVVGIDLSEPMLSYAKENAATYLESGQATFIQADAVDFKLDERFGLVVSTFDALNHLGSQEALRLCFQCVYPLLLPGGLFIFDLSTRAGLRRWNGINVQDDDEAMIVTRGFYDGQGDRAWTHLSGFVRVEGGLYERFEETVFNTVFDMD